MRVMSPGLTQSSHAWDRPADHPTAQTGRLIMQPEPEPRPPCSSSPEKLPWQEWLGQKYGSASFPCCTSHGSAHPVPRDGYTHQRSFRTNSHFLIDHSPHKRPSLMPLFSTGNRKRNDFRDLDKQAGSSPGLLMLGS